MTALDPTTRATAALGVPPDADAAAVREAFLRKLADADYAPPEGWVAAVNRLGGTAIPLSRDAVASEADVVRDEIDAFAAGFWGLDPDARRAKWNDLHARCPAGPSAAFLKQMEIGLGVAVAPHADESVEAVASLARELFVLRPRPRAVRRAEWLANHEATDSQKAVAERLAAEQPGVAALDPILFGRLTGKIGRGEAVGADLTALENPAFTISSDVNYPPAISTSIPQPTQSDTGSQVKAGMGILFVLFLVVRVGFGLLSGSSSSSPKNPYPPPPYEPPAGYYPKVKTPTFQARTFTEQEISQYLRYERSNKKDTLPPDGYIPWVLQGKPIPSSYYAQPILPSTRR